MARRDRAPRGAARPLHAVVELVAAATQSAIGPAGLAGLDRGASHAGGLPGPSCPRGFPRGDRPGCPPGAVRPAPAPRRCRGGRHGPRARRAGVVRGSTGPASALGWGAVRSGRGGGAGRGLRLGHGAGRFTRCERGPGRSGVRWGGAVCPRTAVRTGDAGGAGHAGCPGHRPPHLGAGRFRGDRDAALHPRAPAGAGRPSHRRAVDRRGHPTVHHRGRGPARHGPGRMGTLRGGRRAGHRRRGRRPGHRTGPPPRPNPDPLSREVGVTPLDRQVVSGGHVLLARTDTRQDHGWTGSRRAGAL